MSRTANKKSPRQRFYVDPKVQGALAVRVVLYWLTCLVTVALMLLLWQIVTGPARLFYTHLGDLWFFHGPALVASLILLPMVVIDMIRFSNRFAGPLFRLRRSMRALAAGEPVEPLQFRDSDFWQEFAQQFNAVAARVEAAEAAGHRAAEATRDESPELVGSGAQG